MAAKSVLSRCMLLALGPNSIVSSLGIQAAKRIEYLLHPRGCKAGFKHVKTQTHPIQTVVNQFGRYKSGSRTVRPRVLVPIHTGLAMPIETVIGHRPQPVHSDRSDVNKHRILTSFHRNSDPIPKLRLQCSLWNARSVRDKCGAVISSILENQTDVFVITETWLRDQNDPTIGDLKSSLFGYDIIHCPRSQRKGGGVAVIARKNLRSKQIRTVSFNSFESVVIDIRSSSEVVRVVVVYRPPYSNKNKNSAVSKFLPDFARFLETLLLGPGHLLITGDLNFHLDDPNDADQLKFCDLLSSMGLRQLVTDPTHRNGHILDVVIVREADSMVMNCEIGPDMRSDHFSVHFSLKIRKPPASRSVVERRNMRGLDLDVVRAKLASLEAVSSEDPNVLLRNYNEGIISTLNELAPVKKKIISDKPRANWWNEDLQNERTNVRRLERKWKKSQLTIDKEIYHAARDVYHKNLETAKRDYHRNEISASSTKQLFGIVDNLICGKGMTASVIPTNVPPPDLPELFSDFYRDRVQSFRDALPAPECSPGTKPAHEFSKFEPVSEEYVRKLFQSMSTKTSALDPISTNILKQCESEVVPIFTKLINASITSGIFPDALKTAVIRPLLKKAGLDSDVLKNYRPVANIPFLAKLIEKVVKDQMDEYLSNFNLFSKFQSAYRSNYSTETALVRVYNDIMRSLDKKRDVILCLADFSAAFETVDHDILLNRLQYRFGFTGTALEWFCSYLVNRRQYVSISSTNSPASKSKSSKCESKSSHDSSHYTPICGVPQGTTLGPILFTLYVSPLEDILVKNNLNPMLFADDTQMYVTCDHYTEVQSKLEECIDELKSWMNDNLLVMNESKTEVVHFRSRFKKDVSVMPSLRVCDAHVATTSSVRNLGVFLDEHGLMRDNLKQICKSASYGLWKVGRIRHLLNQSQAEKLVHAFITSRLDYCNALLHGLPSTALLPLQTIQNSAARMITLTNRYQPITPILYDLHWLPVVQRIEFKILILTFKCLHGMAPSYLSELLTVYRPARTLRSMNDCTLISPGTGNKKYYGPTAFSVCAPNLWNALTPDLRSITDFSTFKARLKTHLFRQHYTNVNF